MSSRSPVRLYCAAVFLAGIGLSLLALPDARMGWIVHMPLSFALLSAGVLLGEMLPIRIPRRGGEDYEELTLSGAFALALLITGGLGPALIAQGVASIVQDVYSKKPPWRVRFNLGQYFVAMLVAWLVVRLFAVDPRLDILHPISSGQLPAMLAGSVVFALVNRLVVGVAVALYQGVTVRAHFRENGVFGMVTGSVILLTAPIVLAAASYSVAIVPLCLAPIVAMYNSISQSARSEHLARHDSLTGLPNRMFFQQTAESILEGAESGCVLLLDLDRFKDVNDTLGHRVGDLLLSHVAVRFREVVGNLGEIARLGGDEFALIASGCSRDQARELAQSVADSLRDSFQLEELVVDVQASVGIALFPDHGTDIETLLQKADVAMYRAKESSADIEFYDERHDHHSPSKLALTGELRAAVSGPQLVVWYQPQLDLHTGQLTDIEALVRWEHPGRGLLAPDAFLRMAEQTSLIKPLTDRVLRTALGQVAAWRRLGLDPTVAVNISTRSLVDRDFTGQVMAALNEAEVPPASLRLEVTESALMADPVTSHTVLHELDELGVKISIDDFGTGYSSLAYLADLPVSEVKIDRSFVMKMDGHAKENIIVSSTIDLAHHLGLCAVAEGVEDPAQIRRLEALGCDVAQGYAIARPAPAPEATQLLLGGGFDADAATFESGDTESPSERLIVSSAIPKQEVVRWS
ncbi:MAG TPA: EAL domain-containing protein [Solirubrobacteraceae bacterium]|jgi:diguanylate cyclase (GGDEF)-like protein